MDKQLQQKIAEFHQEQNWQQMLDQRTDVYALGATLYEILTGRPPFKGETHFNIVNQILHKDPILPRTLNPEVPIELEAICLKSLEKKPGKRYQSAKIWTQDLENFLAHKPILAKPPTIINTIQKLIWRNKLVSLLLFFVFCSLLVLIVSLQINLQKEREQKEKEKEIKLKESKKKKK